MMSRLGIVQMPISPARTRGRALRDKVLARVLGRLGLVQA
jgi:hypothetical protein